MTAVPGPLLFSTAYMQLQARQPQLQDIKAGINTQRSGCSRELLVLSHYGLALLEWASRAGQVLQRIAMQGRAGQGRGTARNCECRQRGGVRQAQQAQHVGMACLGLAWHAQQDMPGPSYWWDSPTGHLTHQHPPAHINTRPHTHLRCSSGSCTGGTSSAVSISTSCWLRRAAARPSAARQRAPVAGGQQRVRARQTGACKQGKREVGKRGGCASHSCLAISCCWSRKAPPLYRSPDATSCCPA